MLFYLLLPFLFPYQWTLSHLLLKVSFPVACVPFLPHFLIDDGKTPFWEP